MSDQALRLYLPGPVTTDPRTRAAMARDWGVWDDEFRTLTAYVRTRLLELAGGGETHGCVLVQGSGSFGVEAMVQTFLPRGGHLLIPVNGKYGERIATICQKLGRRCTLLTVPEGTAVDPNAIDAALAEDPAISHVVAVHCETSSGTLNPLDEIAKITRVRGRKLLIDAVSTFGAFDLDAAQLDYQALATSPNKCLEGVPGCAIVIAPQDALRTAMGNATSHSLDLADQWAQFEATGQWRFTPPTFVVAALAEALRLHAAEGGNAARLDRYRDNHAALSDAMEGQGFVPLMDRALQAPIVISYRDPADPRFGFTTFYQRLRARGFMIYPGHLTDIPTFRIACIGALAAQDMRDVATAIGDVCREMGVRDFAP